MRLPDHAETQAKIRATIHQPAFTAEGIACSGDEFAAARLADKSISAANSRLYARRRHAVLVRAGEPRAAS